MIDPIDTSVLPPDVRAAGPAAERLYAGALGFEQELTQQLAQSLADSAQPDDGSDDDSGDDAVMAGDATTSMYQQMLPDAMAQGVTAAGGLGLADQLYRSLRMKDGSA